MKNARVLSIIGAATLLLGYVLLAFREQHLGFGLSGFILVPLGGVLLLRGVWLFAEAKEKENSTI